jgi:hypothetical protein
LSGAETPSPAFLQQRVLKMIEALKHVEALGLFQHVTYGS